eukprot:1397160-Alexandrium_andersonii.AAC.1
MSASLVGSEMCIRDRTNHKKVGGRCALLGPSGWTERACPWGVGSVGFVAVSYTHLTLPTICSV